MKIFIVLLCLSGCRLTLAEAGFVDFDLGLIYPQELGGMRFDRVEKYESEDLGYTVFYTRDGGFSAEVSVYTLGRDSIEDGHKGTDIALVFQSVEGLMNKEQEGGVISGMRKRKASEIPAKGDIRFANQIFQFSQPRVVEGRTNAVPRINSVYAKAAHNHFFKVQFRFDTVNGKVAGGMVKQLITQLITTIKTESSEEQLLLAGCDALINNPSDYAGRIAGQQVWAKARTMGNLNVYTHLFVWPDGYGKPKNADLLTAAYFAGMLKVVVPQKLEEGGEEEAFEAMLEAYKNMRFRNDIEVIPKLDEWLKNPDKKALFQQLLYAPAE